MKISQSKMVLGMLTFIIMDSSCKKLTQDDGPDPAFQVPTRYNDPPLGKDTINGTIESLDFPVSSNVIYFTIRDRDNDSLYEGEFWYSASEWCETSIDTPDLINPLSIFSYPPPPDDSLDVIISNPNTVHFSFSVQPADSPHFCMAIKQLNASTTAQTTVDYAVNFKYQRPDFMATDSSSRAKAKKEIEDKLKEATGYSSGGRESGLFYIKRYRR